MIKEKTERSSPQEFLSAVRQDFQTINTQEKAAGVQTEPRCHDDDDGNDRIRKNPIKSFYDREEEKTFSPETSSQNSKLKRFWSFRCFFRPDVSRWEKLFIFFWSGTFTGHMTAGEFAGGGLKVSFQTDGGKICGCSWIMKHQLQAAPPGGTKKNSDVAGREEKESQRQTWKLNSIFKTKKLQFSDRKVQRDSLSCPSLPGLNFLTQTNVSVFTDLTCKYMNYCISAQSTAADLLSVTWLHPVSATL